MPTLRCEAIVKAKYWLELPYFQYSTHDGPTGTILWPVGRKRHHTLTPHLEPPMKIHPLLVLAMAISVVACQPRFTTSVDENGGTSNGESDTSTDDAYSDWEGAQLMVQSPQRAHSYG